MGSYLSMAIISAEYAFEMISRCISIIDKTCLPRPLWPRIVATPSRRGFREKFEIGDRSRTVAHGGPDAIITRVSASNNNDILSFRIDIFAVLKARIQQRCSIQLEKKIMSI